jgi:hypothetical protein
MYDSAGKFGSVVDLVLVDNLFFLVLLIRCNFGFLIKVTMIFVVFLGWFVSNTTILDSCCLIPFRMAVDSTLTVDAAAVTAAAAAAGHRRRTRLDSENILEEIHVCCRLIVCLFGSSFDFMRRNLY